jgi:1-acyl-sn-glycerol-3-phosphate acyltransferase
MIKRVRYYYFIALIGFFFIRGWQEIKKALREKNYRKAHALRRELAKNALKAGGIQLKIKNEFNPEPEKVYIICANHGSYLDIPVLAATVPLYFGYMGKGEIGNLPFIKIFYRTLDIPVLRNDVQKSGIAFKKALQSINEGKSLVIFPEGGMMGDARKLYPFKRGPFELAKRMNLRILPVGLPENYKRMDDYSKKATRGEIHVILHPAIDPKNYSVEELMEKVGALLEADIKQYNL